MDKTLAKLRKAFDDRPIETIGVIALAATALSKVMHANTERKNAKTYRMEVQRRMLNKNR